MLVAPLICVGAALPGATALRTAAAWTFPISPCLRWGELALHRP